MGRMVHHFGDCSYQDLWALMGLYSTNKSNHQRIGCNIEFGSCSSFARPDCKSLEINSRRDYKYIVRTRVVKGNQTCSFGIGVCNESGGVFNDLFFTDGSNCRFWTITICHIHIFNAGHRVHGMDQRNCSPFRKHPT